MEIGIVHQPTAASAPVHLLVQRDAIGSAEQVASLDVLAPGPGAVGVEAVLLGAPSGPLDEVLPALDAAAAVASRVGAA